MNNKIKNLVVVVFVETVEFLNKIALRHSFRRQKHVKNFVCLLNIVFFIRKI